MLPDDENFSCAALWAKKFTRQPLTTTGATIQHDPIPLPFTKPDWSPTAPAGKASNSFAILIMPPDQTRHARTRNGEFMEASAMQAEKLRNKAA